jgi:hypothetical protein
MAAPTNTITYKARVFNGDFFANSEEKDGEEVRTECEFPTLASVVADANEFIADTVDADESDDLDDAYAVEDVEIVEFVNGEQSRSMNLAQAILLLAEIA